MAGSAAAANLVEEKLSHLQLVQENDNLKSQVSYFYRYKLSIVYADRMFCSIYVNFLLQIRDLIEKVETLRVKRMQDKERMKDFEKTKLQVEQLLEFKAKVMESQVSIYIIFIN
jgi:dynactin 1